MLLSEFLRTEKLHPQSRFEPIVAQAQLICAILYMIVILYMAMKQIQIIYQLKINYFRQFCSWIHLGIIGCSWANVSIFVWRYHQSHHVGNLFRDRSEFAYVNLQLTVSINDTFTFLLSFCGLFGTLTSLRLCRYNPQLSLFTEIIRQARNDLLVFTYMFSVIFMAFLMLFYLLFSSKLRSYCTLLHTAQMLFEMMLMKFDANESSDGGACLGPFSFSLFILFVVFMCMSIFMTAIIDYFLHARDNVKLFQMIINIFGSLCYGKFSAGLV